MLAWFRDLTAKERSTMWACFGGWSLDAFDVQMYSFVIPTVIAVWGLSRGEAELYIRSYFERYIGVKKFIESTIAEVRRTGVTRTLLGRERPIPEMNSRNPSARGFAERTAVNSPLQGTAADLIKLAMVHIDRRMREEKRQVAMLLQVHDELVFEAPPEETQKLSAMVKHEMEQVYPLEVPLVADIGVGENWRDAK